tara:strand:- start:280 stop:828 length:549 start_codon:yes stop_codon:yes gene_type:complete
MATTTVNRGDAYITDGVVTHSGTTTTITTTGTQIVVHIIPTTKIDYNYDNNIVSIPIPVSLGDRAKLPLNRIIDLKRIKESITIQGFLEDSSGSSAENKRDDLLTLGKHRGELTVVYGHKYTTNNYQTIFERNSVGRGVFILKMGFTSTAGKVGLDVGGPTNEETGERNIGINITLLRGRDM